MNVEDRLFVGSRDQVISEDDFLPVFLQAASGLLRLRKKVGSLSGHEIRRRFISRLLKEVHGLRTVLNEYQARENRRYSYFSELVSGIRGFANICYILVHLKERFRRSPLAESEPRASSFYEEIESTLDWSAGNLRALVSALIDECRGLGLALPGADPEDGEDGEDAETEPAIRRHLPHNTDEEEMTDGGGWVAQVASSFLRAAEVFGQIDPGELSDFVDLRDFVRSTLDEEQARSLQFTIHAIQSKYDTYVQYTYAEYQDPDLKQLRSVVSIVLHLFEVTTHLVHFYERHENDIRSAKVKERISLLVDKTAVLERAVNFGLRAAAWFFEEGSRAAERLIPAYTSIREVAYPIPDAYKLHLRPAALIAGIVNFHGTPVRMRMGEDECDACSVTEVIFLAGSNVDAKEAVFIGDEKPLADLKVLFDVGLADDGHAAVQEALPYLQR